MLLALRGLRSYPPPAGETTLAALRTFIARSSATFVLSTRLGNRILKGAESQQSSRHFLVDNWSKENRISSATFSMHFDENGYSIIGYLAEKEPLKRKFLFRRSNIVSIKSF